MKSRKVKAYQAHKRAKPDLVLDENDSDVNEDSFFHDDIEDFNDKKDNELSTDDELIQHGDDSSEEEEVLPITDDEKEDSDDENSSEKDDSEDDTDDDKEQGLPNRDAWGKKKSAYYSADFVDEDRGRTYREDDAEAARAEADEAFAIQKSIYSGVKADNLGANLFLEGSEESSEEENVDISSATTLEKMRYLKTETKVLEVFKEYNSALKDLAKFSTLSKLVKEKKIVSKNLGHYINTKLEIVSVYGMNLSMYCVFISSGRNPKHHPLLQQIASLKEQLDELKPVDDIVGDLIDKLYEKHERGEEVEFCSESEAEDDVIESTIERSPKGSIQTDKEGKKVKKTKTKHVETENEKQVMSLLKEVKEELKKRKHEDSDEEEEEEDMLDENKPSTSQDDNNTEEKRIISYEIAKNKGLVPHRKKEYRNPRVRHRMKFRKANIRRKGQVRKVVKEVKRYEGEQTGININVVKSIKFK